MFNVITIDGIILVDKQEHWRWYDDVLNVVKTNSDNFDVDSGVEYICRELEGANYHSEMDMFLKMWKIIAKSVGKKKQKTILFN